MGLRELDKEYREMAHFSDTEKLQYCEDLITRMRKRLSSDDAITSNIRTLLMEMIESAEREMQMLIMDKHRKNKR